MPFKLTFDEKTGQVTEIERDVPTKIQIALSGQNITQSGGTFPVESFPDVLGPGGRFTLEGMRDRKHAPPGTPGSGPGNIDAISTISIVQVTWNPTCCWVPVGRRWVCIPC